jgi:predicted DNA-binding transcriptional regulator YafY
MLATARHIRRSIRAALTTSRHVVSAAVSAHYRLLVHLYRAIDTGATLRIRYTDEDGARTVRDITPHRLWISSHGHTLVTTWDHLRDARRDFRTDRITIAA